MTGHNVVNRQRGAGSGQVVVGQLSQGLDFVSVVRQFAAGEVLRVGRVAVRRVNEHVGEDHLIESVFAGGIVALDGIVDHQEGEEGIRVVSAGLSSHGAAFQLRIQVRQEVRGNHGDLAGQALGFDAGDGAQQGVSAAARNDQSVDVGIRVDNGFSGGTAGIGRGAAVLRLQQFNLVDRKKNVTPYKIQKLKDILEWGKDRCVFNFDNKYITYFKTRNVKLPPSLRWTLRVK